MFLYIFLKNEFLSVLIELFESIQLWSGFYLLLNFLFFHIVKFPGQEYIVYSTCYPTYNEVAKKLLSDCGFFNQIFFTSENLHQLKKIMHFNCKYNHLVVTFTKRFFTFVFVMRGAYS